MLNLKVINYGKKERYLGVAGIFLIEVPDHDKAILHMLPAGIKFRASESSAFSGRNLRMVLRNNNHDCLAIIKNSKTFNKGEKRAELVCFVNNSSRKDKELFDEVRILASHRWPSGKLFIKTKTIKKHNESLIETLLMLGWKYSSLPNGNQILELQLFQR